MSEEVPIPNPPLSGRDLAADSVGRNRFSTIMKTASTLFSNSHSLSFRTFTVGQYLSYPLLYNSTRENRSITKTTVSKINEMKTVTKTARKVPAHDLPRLASNRLPLINTSLQRGANSPGGNHNRFNGLPFPAGGLLSWSQSKFKICKKRPISKQFKPFQRKKINDLLSTKSDHIPGDSLARLP